MKSIKFASVVTLGLLSMSLAGCGNNDNQSTSKTEQTQDNKKYSEEKEDINVDATKYTFNPKTLIKQFESKNKGYVVTSVELDDDNNHVGYEVTGIDTKNHSELNVIYDAKKTSRIIHQEKESYDDNDEITLKINDVNVSPKDAMDKSKKEIKSNRNADGWKLEMTEQSVPVYKVQFESPDTTVMINAKNGHVVATENDD